MKLRAQASHEYLTTYGLALIAVITAGALLLEGNWLDMSQPPMSPVGLSHFKVHLQTIELKTTGEFQVVMQNLNGVPITVHDVKIKVINFDKYCDFSTAQYSTLQASQDFKVIATGCSQAGAHIGDEYEAEIYINYTSTIGDLERSRIEFGEVRGRFV